MKSALQMAWEMYGFQGFIQLNFLLPLFTEDAKLMRIILDKIKNQVIYGTWCSEASYRYGSEPLGWCDW